ncbi:hypothetical protein CLNEO_27330 [Anaerotignum neopropionicum]|uniref:Uncharacterized protein n=1 Tax=Anaerotignum neopropionicum TaxID=36847 RepID=A0A136WBK1_9FIRM|nr:hypothetical protein CLNEO_27330 [Anaerotignum neopropionicum]
MLYNTGIHHLLHHKVWIFYRPYGIMTLDSIERR